MRERSRWKEVENRTLRYVLYQESSLVDPAMYVQHMVQRRVSLLVTQVVLVQ